MSTLVLSRAIEASAGGGAVGVEAVTEIREGRKGSQPPTVMTANDGRLVVTARRDRHYDRCGVESRHALSRSAHVMAGMNGTVQAGEPAGVHRQQDGSEITCLESKRSASEREADELAGVAPGQRSPQKYETNPEIVDSVNSRKPTQVTDKIGRGGEIRTPDPHNPIVTLDSDETLDAMASPTTGGGGMTRLLAIAALLVGCAAEESPPDEPRPLSYGESGSVMPWPRPDRAPMTIRDAGIYVYPDAWDDGGWGDGIGRPSDG